MASGSEDGGVEENSRIGIADGKEEKRKEGFDKESNQTFIEKHVRITSYKGELQMQSIMDLIDGELSEPYTVYTYRYFLNQWPQLCFLAHYIPNPEEDFAEGQDITTIQKPIGVVIGKLDKHFKGNRLMRGYIGMISIQKDFRGKGIASELLKTELKTLIKEGAQEIVLETEIDNKASLRLYEKFGFICEKRLFNFYLNGKDCFRLICEIPKTYWQQPLTPPPRPLLGSSSTISNHQNQNQNRTKDLHSGPTIRSNDPNYSFSQMRIDPSTPIHHSTQNIFSHSDIL